MENVNFDDLHKEWDIKRLEGIKNQIMKIVIEYKDALLAGDPSPGKSICVNGGSAAEAKAVVDGLIAEHPTLRGHITMWDLARKGTMVSVNKR